MDDLTPMEPEYQENGPQLSDPRPDSYGTGRPPAGPRTPLSLALLLLLALVLSNLITLSLLLPRQEQRQTETPPIQGQSTGQPLPQTDPASRQTESTEATQADSEPARELTPTELFEKLSASLVTVHSGQRSGLGVILSENGFLLSTWSLVGRGGSLSVTLPDGQQHPAVLVGADADCDLAVLHIDAWDLQPGEFISAQDLAIGQEVTVLGMPFGEGFGLTLTGGSIAGIVESVSVGQRQLRVLQVTAPQLCAGGSAVICNSLGQIVAFGVGSLGQLASFETVSDVGFALPSEQLTGLVKDLVEFGQIRSMASLGVQVEELSSQQRAYWQLPEGLAITGVSAGSAAEAAGLQPGDLLLSIEGYSVPDLDSYRQALSRHQAGDRVRLVIYRSGAHYYVDLTLTPAAG